MRAILTIVFSIFCFAGKAQYHVNVIPNPSHKGQVNKGWMNNYVVSYTNDNWKTSKVVNSQITYSGYDAQNQKYYTSYFEIISFQNIKDGVAFAKQFQTLKSVERYEKYMWEQHIRLKTKWDAENKNRTVRDPSIQNGKTVKIY